MFNWLKKKSSEHSAHNIANCIAEIKEAAIPFDAAMATTGAPKQRREL